MGEDDDPLADPETESETEARHPSVDALLEVLANATRRRVVWHVQEQGATPVDELVDVLAGWELADDSAGVVDAAKRERIATALHHVHLPKLVAAGLVEFEDGVVEPTHLDEQVETLVALTRKYDAAPADDRERG